MVNTNSKNSTIEGIFFSEHWLRAIESDVAPSNRDCADLRVRRICFAEYTSLDQVDRHRHRYGESQTKRPSPQSFPWAGRVGREAPVEDRSYGKNTRPLQADQLKTISQRLPRIHFPFHQDRSRRAGSTGGWRSVQAKATSRDGVTRAGVIDAVAATRGSSPTRQFRAARKSDHTPRHSRFNWPNGASNCTASRESKRCLIRFSVLEIPPSLHSAVA